MERYHYTVDGKVEPICDEEFPCDDCDDVNCDKCEKVSIEMMLSHMFRGDLSDVICVGDFGDDDDDDFLQTDD